MDLQRENENLKDIVKEKLEKGIAQQILDGCDALERIPPSVWEACSEGFDDMDAQDFHQVESIQITQHALL